MYHRFDEKKYPSTNIQLNVFKEQFNQDTFPIPVKEIRIVEDSHTAVSRGCLSETQLIEDEENESETNKK